MVSIQKCRETLGSIALNLTDKDIEQIRDYIYSIGREVINNNISAYEKNIKKVINQKQKEL
jgi:hypothetical protein